MYCIAYQFPSPHEQLWRPQFLALLPAVNVCRAHFTVSKNTSSVVSDFTVSETIVYWPANVESCTLYCILLYCWLRCFIALIICVCISVIQPLNIDRPVRDLQTMEHVNILSCIKQGSTHTCSRSVCPKVFIHVRARCFAKFLQADLLLIYSSLVFVVPWLSYTFLSPVASRPIILILYYANSLSRDRKI